MEERKQEEEEEEATDHRPRDSITKQATDDLWKQKWIRKQTNEDGYFLIQLARNIEHNDMFLTAEGDSSLKIERK